MPKVSPTAVNRAMASSSSASARSGPAAEALGEGGGHGQVPARLGGADEPAQQHGVLGDGERHGPAVVDDPGHGQGGEERR